MRLSRITGWSTAAAQVTWLIGVAASSAALSATSAASRNEGPAARAAAMLGGNRARATRTAASAVAPRRCRVSAYARPRSTTLSSSGWAATMRDWSPSGVATLIRPNFTSPPTGSIRLVQYRLHEVRVTPPGPSSYGHSRRCGQDGLPFPHGCTERGESKGRPAGDLGPPRRPAAGPGVAAEALHRGHRATGRRQQDDDLPLVAEQGRPRHRLLPRQPRGLDAGSGRGTGSRGLAQAPGLPRPHLRRS